MKDPNKPPCAKCTARCCKKGATDHRFAVALVPEDGKRFDDVSVYDDGEKGKVIPFKYGKCIFLKDDRCSIYTTRPTLCKEYSCATGVRKDGSLCFFLGDTPAVVQLLVDEGYVAPKLVDLINDKYNFTVPIKKKEN